VAWVDRSGKRLDTITQPGRIGTFALARDQTQLAITSAANDSAATWSDIWL